MALVMVGACYIDTILTTPYYPGEDDKLRASSLHKRRGGNCPNSAEVLAQILAEDKSSTGCKTPAWDPIELVSVLPARSSTASREIIASFGQGVSLDHCVYREGHSEPASSYIIKSQANSSRTIVNYNELEEMECQDIRLAIDALAGRAAWFHFEGRNPPVACFAMQTIRKEYPHIKLSVEIEKPGREGLPQLAGEADVVFFSKSWAQDQKYVSAEECVREQAKTASKARYLFCTWGQDGAVGNDIARSQIIHGQAFQPEKVVDTIGAGDTFIAGMLFALMRREEQWILARKLDFANRLAGLKVAQEGFAGLGSLMVSYMS
ncbi:hypothetical protein ASPZODRAFT_28549 [Penicilliopsis zonata CBS 506.65]|uniref:Carbohydrate kinase PfkB domain-containing protein n=1 Tax=Penicilliopsis zonata CBS 506.65 TaxID=1073090 RepID=A0A1L9S7W5_9EURO|nr:hypothetical protein ASPZODRAFT_28549 [Penicilliopsis zonata CBS 506.65]OJJ43237.1 hypothetical protein ASPZODRAFT_28549 [Penicilliopsis zonata CBS 506.65]